MKRKKDDYKKNKIDLFCELLFWVGVPVVFALCCIIFSLTAKASGTESTAYFPMSQNQNGHITQRDIDYMSQYIDLENNYYMAYYYGVTGNGNTAKHLFYIVTFPKSSTGMVYGEIQSNGYKFNLYNIGTIDSNCALYDFKIQVGEGYYSERYTRASGAFSNIVSYFNGYTSSVYDTNRDYISNFKIWTSNNESNRGVILKYGTELPPDFEMTGHAVPPDTFENPVYTTGHTPPQNVPPTYTVNNYTWNTYTPPTVNTSSLENLVKSLIDITKYNAEYLKDNLHNEFSNLINNVKGFVDYLGQTINYYGDLIISNIQNGITTFYNNMANLVTGIKDGIGFITQPLDLDVVSYCISETGIMSDVQSIGTIKTEAFGVFDTVSEPQTFKIPLDLRSITMLGQTQITYIDLGWLSDARPYIRAFMWVCVTFGLLYSIIIDIPTMLRSGAK